METESFLVSKSRSYKPELEFPRSTSQPITLSALKIADFERKESGRTTVKPLYEMRQIRAIDANKHTPYSNSPLPRPATIDC